MDNKEPIISTGHKTILLAFAIGVDVLNLMLLLVGVGIAVNTVISFIAFASFALYFMSIDTRIITNGSNIWIALKGEVGEAIPFINVLPLWYRTVKKIINNSNATIGNEEVAPKMSTDDSFEPRNALETQ